MEHFGQQLYPEKTKDMHISIPKPVKNLAHSNKRAALWMSSDPQGDANKFTSEKYYVLFSSLKSPSVQSAPGENVTSYIKI